MSDRRMSTWRAAGRVSRYRIGLFSLSFVRLAAWNGSMLLIGWVLQQVFDALGGDAPTGWGVLELVAVLAAAEAVRILLMWGWVVELRSREYMRGLLRLNLLRAQMHSGGPEAGASATSSGEAVSRFRDDVEDFLALPQTALSAAGKVVLTVGSMAVMLSVQPLIAVAVVVPLGAVVVVTRLASGRIRAYRAAYRRASAAVTGLIGEMFGSVLAVKSGQAGDGILKQLALLNERRRRTGQRDQLVSQLLSSFNRATVDLSVGVVLLLAAPAMRHGGFTIGDLALFVSYIGLLVWVPYYAGQLMARQRQAEVAIDRMTTLLPPRAPDALVAHRSLRAPQPLGPTEWVNRVPLQHLTVCDLTATHPASGRGVFDVSLAVERGTFAVITGPAGAGKTTLLRAVLGLLPAEAGGVYWNDDVVEDRAEYLVPPRSAFVPQVPGLFSDSLRDNVLLGHEDSSALQTAVRTAVLDQDVASMPSGLETPVGARGVRLSGGQVQRAAIARALVRRTDLLVLDDVSSALDVETERRLWDRLLADADRTLLVVSNRPATIARADQVIQLDQGRVQPDSVLRASRLCVDAA
jgi:ATP-binding cassette, subfamily B, bacterial